MILMEIAQQNAHLPNQEYRVSEVEYPLGPSGFAILHDVFEKHVTI